MSVQELRSNTWRNKSPPLSWGSWLSAHALASRSTLNQLAMQLSLQVFKILERRWIDGHVVTLIYSVQLVYTDYIHTIARYNHYRASLIAPTVSCKLLWSFSALRPWRCWLASVSSCCDSWEPENTQNNGIYMTQADVKGSREDDCHKSDMHNMPEETWKMHVLFNFLSGARSNKTWTKLTSKLPYPGNNVIFDPDNAGTSTLPSRSASICFNHFFPSTHKI